MNVSKPRICWSFFSLLVLSVLIYLGPGCSPSPSGNTNEGTVTDAASGNDATSQVTDSSHPPTDHDTTDASQPTESNTTQDEKAPPPDQSTSSGWTWYKHIQPLIQQNCQTCHQQGGVGPFPLTNYEEVKTKASLVKWSVETGRMPPWGATEDPAKNCLEFADSRKLRPQEVQAIVSWIDGGLALGDPKDAQPYQPKEDKLDSIDAEVDTQTD